MTHMQVTVRLRRKTGNYPLYFATGEIFFNDFGNEVVTTSRSVCHNHLKAENNKPTPATVTGMAFAHARQVLATL